VARHKQGQTSGKGYCFPSPGGPCDLIALSPAGGTSNGDDHRTDDHRPPLSSRRPLPSSAPAIALFLPQAFFFHFSHLLAPTRPFQCASPTSPSLPRTGPRSAYPLNSTTGVVCTLSVSRPSGPYQPSDFSPSTSTRHQLVPATLQLSHTSRLFDFHFPKNPRNHDHGRRPGASRPHPSRLLHFPHPSGESCFHLRPIPSQLPSSQTSPMPQSKVFRQASRLPLLSRLPMRRKYRR
jgi:hypothetical protein